MVFVWVAAGAAEAAQVGWAVAELGDAQELGEVALAATG